MLAINNLEVSGWEVHLTNLLYNAISGSDREWVLDDKREIAFAKYIRYEFDGRYNKEYTKTTSFASRLNFGIIVPFGNNPSAPFIRQFGVGGPNSLRAWNIKEPGPDYIGIRWEIERNPGHICKSGRYQTGVECGIPV